MMLSLISQDKDKVNSSSIHHNKIHYPSATSPVYSSSVLSLEPGHPESPWHSDGSSHACHGWCHPSGALYAASVTAGHSHQSCGTNPKGIKAHAIL